MISKQPKHIKSEENPTPVPHEFRTAEVQRFPLQKMIHKETGNEAMVNETQVDQYRAKGYETEHEAGNRRGQSAISEAKRKAAEEKAKADADALANATPSTPSTPPAQVTPTAPKSKRKAAGEGKPKKKK